MGHVEKNAGRSTRKVRRWRPCLEGREEKNAGGNTRKVRR